MTCFFCYIWNTMLKFLLFIIILVVIIALIGFSMIGKILSFLLKGTGSKSNSKSQNINRSAKKDKNVLFEKEGMKVFKGSAGAKEETK